MTTSPMARVGWYARRPRSMAPAEIALHARRAERQAAAGAVDLGAILVPMAPGATVPAVGLELTCDRDSCVARTKIGDDEREFRLDFANPVAAALSRF